MKAMDAQDAEALKAQVLASLQESLGDLVNSGRSVNSVTTFMVTPTRIDIPGGEVFVQSIEVTGPDTISVVMQAQLAQPANSITMTFKMDELEPDRKDPDLASAKLAEAHDFMAKAQLIVNELGPLMDEAHGRILQAGKLESDKARLELIERMRHTSKAVRHDIVPLMVNLSGLLDVIEGKGLPQDGTEEKAADGMGKKSKSWSVKYECPIHGDDVPSVGILPDKTCGIHTPTPTNSYCICGEVVKEMDEPVDPKDLWCPAHGRIADLVLYTKPLSCGVPTPAGLLCGEPLYEKQSTAQLHAEMTNFKPDPDDFPEPLDTI